MKLTYNQIKNEISASNMPISICVYLMKLVDANEKKQTKQS